MAKKSIPMTLEDVLSALESMGTEQNRKVYKRHGVQGELFGVSYANLGKLEKKIKQDHPFALQLWATGNHDARVLATKIADPQAEGVDLLLDQWVQELDNYVLTDAFVAYCAQTALADSRCDIWSNSANEFVGQAGWSLLAYLAGSKEERPDAFFAARLERIEREIHQNKNRVRHAMNMALISIGGRNPQLRDQAIAGAEKIGKVEVDHGETSCKTPAAVPYIEKMWRRKNKAK